MITFEHAGLVISPYSSLTLRGGVVICTSGITWLGRQDRRYRGLVIPNPPYFPEYQDCPPCLLLSMTSSTLRWIMILLYFDIL